MKKKTTPLTQRGGTAKRQAETQKLIAGLEKMRGRDPVAFAEMMRTLAHLVVSVRSKKSRTRVY